MTQTQRSVLIFDALSGGPGPTGLVDNQAFMPAPDAEPALHKLCHTVTVSSAPLLSDKPMLGAKAYAGLRADLFPSISLGLVSTGDDVMPVERGLLSEAERESYWDLVVSPGKIWSEPGDLGMTRVVLPIQLSNVLENDTHHGLATFLFDDTVTTPLRFQISVETKNFVIPETFDAWGTAALERVPLDEATVALPLSAYEQEMAQHLALRPWSDLAEKGPAALMAAAAEGFGADSEIVCGLAMEDEIFATPCRTRSGPYPFPLGMKFGIWSATKTAFGTLACLHLARITGEDPRSELIADLIPEAKGLEQWAEVTVGDCLNMASGIGTAAPHRDGTDVFSDYLLDETQLGSSALGRKSYEAYFAWFLAPSQSEKTAAALACDGYPWKPGEVARYRDQDLYLAGAAMDAWYKQRYGPHSRLWHMVRDEIYKPCGIRHAVMFETIDQDPDQIVPLTDAGLLLSLEHVARLGRLIHNGGRTATNEILDFTMLSEVFDPKRQKGLPTGRQTPDGEIRYHAATWHVPYKSLSGQHLLLPTMLGYGGQMIQILPNRMTAFRFAHDRTDTDERYDLLKLARVADAFQAF